MIVEKQMAVAEGMNAAALAAYAEWIKLVGGQTVSRHEARIVEAAMPRRRRIRANARRLRQAAQAHLCLPKERVLHHSVRIRCDLMILARSVC